MNLTLEQSASLIERYFRIRLGQASYNPDVFQMDWMTLGTNGTNITNMTEWKEAIGKRKFMIGKMKDGEEQKKNVFLKYMISMFPMDESSGTVEYITDFKSQFKMVMRDLSLHLTDEDMNSLTMFFIGTEQTKGSSPEMKESEKEKEAKKEVENDALVNVQKEIKEIGESILRYEKAIEMNKIKTREKIDVTKENVNTILSHADTYDADDIEKLKRDLIQVEALFNSTFSKGSDPTSHDLLHEMLVELEKSYANFFPSSSPAKGVEIKNRIDLLVFNLTGVFGKFKALTISQKTAKDRFARIVKTFDEYQLAHPDVPLSTKSMVNNVSGPSFEFKTTGMDFRKPFSGQYRFNNNLNTKA